MIMYYDMQWTGSQARCERQSGRMHHVSGSYGLAGPICIMHYDMEHMGSQADIQVRQSVCVMYMAGPIHILYHDMHRELTSISINMQNDDRATAQRARAMRSLCTES
jgi:hypothetical protein